ncbi:MAG: helix-turn-helix domain-containing protein [bacterium]|nr:helix-turn-helix domain-containing protein [bacterium]
MITEYFHRLGFHENETHVYLALLEVGEATARDLCRSTSIARTTVYSILSGLVEKGLVSTNVSGTVTRYVASGPAALPQLMEREQVEASGRVAISKQLGALLEPYFASFNLQVPKLSFFNSEANVRQMLVERLPDWEEAMKAADGVLWGYQDYSFVEHYSEWLEYHWKRKDDYYPEMKIQLFSNIVGPEEKLTGRVLNRTIRQLPTGFRFSSTLWIMGDRIVTIRTDKRPHYAFQISDDAFAANLREVFRLLWMLTS